MAPLCAGAFIHCAYRSGLLSLIVPPDKTVADALTAISNERAQAASTNLRLGRSTSLSSFAVAQSRMHDYIRIPPNGLVIFAGKIAAGPADEGETEPRKKLIYAEFEPFIPLDYLTRVVCLCDGTFHVTVLREMAGPAPDPSAMEVDEEAEWHFVAGIIR